MTSYRKEKILSQSFKHEDTISSEISKAYKNKDVTSTPMKNLSRCMNLNSTKEVNVCQFASTVAKYIAIYNDDEEFDLKKDYGSPGAYAEETIETMEDLFLSTLFEIYVHLVINKN